jgi:hypothetical protein
MGTGGPFPGAKARPGRDADHSPHLVPRSRMSRSYTSSRPQATYKTRTFLSDNVKAKNVLLCAVGFCYVNSTYLISVENTWIFIACLASNAIFTPHCFLSTCILRVCWYWHQLRYSFGTGIVRESKMFNLHETIAYNFGL